MNMTSVATWGSAPFTYTKGFIKTIWCYYMSLITAFWMRVWRVADVGLFYIMNAMLLVLETADELLAFSDRVMYNYEVAKKIFKILIHNNIN